MHMMPRLRLLLVEDDIIDRMAIRRALTASELDAELHEATGCQAALDAARQHAFDAFLLDYLLPDGDALTLMRDIRASGHAAPVLILTGQGDERIAVELMKAGASDYLPKEEATAERLTQSLRSALRVHHAEREAADAKRRLESLYDMTNAITSSVAEGLLAFDADARITFANPAASDILGWSPTELLGASIHERIHACVADGSPRREHACSLLAPLREGRIARDEDDVFSRRDGTQFPVSYACSPILTAGHAVGAVLAFHDITERRAAEAQLASWRRQVTMNEKLSALGTLISGVSHEIRTPLTYIANNLFLVHNRLESAAKDRPEDRKLLTEIVGFSTAALDGVDRINALVKDLRPFTRADEAEPRVEASLHEVVATAVELFRATQRGSVDIEASLEPTPHARIDRGQVQRVIINLLSNAAEAMPQGGRVRVRTGASRDGGALIVVQDEGPGIPPEVEDRVFDPFFTTKADGTGLGLSITRRILEQHNGTIHYETTRGRGTTFFVQFPPTKKDSRPGTVQLALADP